MPHARCNAEERSRHAGYFAGREEIIAEIDRHLNAGTSWILITGAPGRGLSALQAHYLDRIETAGVGLLDGPRTRRISGFFTKVEVRPEQLDALAGRLVTKKRNGRRIVPHHFLRRGHRHSARPLDVMRSLASQVEAIFPECRDAENEGASWYLTALLQRVSEVLQKTGKRLVLVIDGLDQYEDDSPVCPLVRFLPVAPPGVSIVCSSRWMPRDAMRWMRDSESYLEIDLDSPAWLTSNDSVCLHYAERIRDEVCESIAVDNVVAASEGCVRYVADLYAALRDQPDAPLDRVPHGFRGFLEHQWDRLNGLPDPTRALGIAGVQSLAAAPQGMLRQELVAHAGWSDEQAETFFGAARPLLIETARTDGTAYCLFHSAFQRFLLEEGHLRSPSRSPEPRLTSTSTTAAEQAIEIDARPAARYFLGVGADDYVEPSLRNLGFCGSDARALADTLSSHSFSVATLHDEQAERALKPTLFNIRAALKGLSEYRFGPEDFLWVHFSCHGMLSSSGAAYLLATDSRTGDLETSALAVSDIVECLKASGARRWLLTLDACHSGVVVGRDGAARLGWDPAFVHNVCDLTQGNAIIAACTSDQEASDSQVDRHGVFTKAILDTLAASADRLAGGILTVDDLKDSVINRVRNWSFSHLGTGEPQEPSFRIEGTGVIIVLDLRAASANSPHRSVG